MTAIAGTRSLPVIQKNWKTAHQQYVVQGAFLLLWLLQSTLSRVVLVAFLSKIDLIHGSGWISEVGDCSHEPSTFSFIFEVVTTKAILCREMVLASNRFMVAKAKLCLSQMALATVE